MPYMAQGAAQATEDAATLAAALKKHSELKLALAVYERQRKPRARYVARNTRVLQEWLHLYDGDGTKVRDAMMKVNGDENPMFWGSSERRDWLFGHDAEVIDEDAARRIPRLPPLPPEECRVYKEMDEMRSRL